MDVEARLLLYTVGLGAAAGLVQLLPETEVPSFDTYFCYPDAMKNQAKLNVFRDWVISKSRTWSF